VTGSQNSSDFRTELLRRFFNPKSYFYSRLTAKLDAYRRSGEIDEQGQEMVERLLHRLEGVSDVSAELTGLSHIGPFQAFHQALHETVDRLETASLDMEAMKLEIEKIAAHLADTLRQVMQNTEERNLLGEWLGLVEPATPVIEPEEPALAPPASDVEELQFPVQPSLDTDQSLPDSDTAASTESEIPLQEPSPEAAAEHELELPFTLETQPADADPEGQTEVSAEQETEPELLQEDDLPPELKEQVEVEISDEEFEVWLNSLRAKEESIYEEVTEEPIPEEEPATERTGAEELQADITAQEAAVATPNEILSTADVTDEPAQETEKSLSEEVGADHSQTASEDAPSAEAPQVSAVSETVQPESPASEPEADLHFLEDMAVPEGLTQVLRAETADLLDRLKQTLAECRREANQDHLEKLEGIFEQIRDVAMIHGSEEIEELATKAWRVCKVFRVNGDDVPGALLDIFEEVHQALSTLLKDGPADDLGRLVQKLLRIERSPETVFEEGRTSPAAEVDAELEPPSQSDRAKIETPKEAPSATVAPQGAEAEAGREEDELRLPGEDDEELIQLITEVRQEVVGGEEAPAVQQPVVSPQTPPKVEPAPRPRIEPRPKAPKQSGPGILERFLEEAELYFGVFDDALAVLKQDPSAQAALEDIELAAYSMKGQCRKLGLEALSRLPEAIEKYAARLISTEQPLSRDGWLAIFRSVHTLRTLTENPKERQKNVWALVRTIKHLAQTPMLRVVSQDDVNTGRKPTVTVSVEEEEERRFRLRGRRSRVGAFGF
jgi:hypothetical protein